jgi:SulP family sulfate permease
MNKNTFVSDLLAGLTVSFAALSLGAAFGAMSGRGAFAGMIGAAIIPIITSIFGGTRLQASGPTAPMTAITAVTVAGAYEMFPDKMLAEQFITLTIIMCGIFLILGGILRIGKLITFVPNAVVLGFMNGIAVLIWYDQIGKIFGIAGKKILEGGTSLNLITSLSTLLLIFNFPKLIKIIGVPEKYRSFFSAILISIISITALVNLINIPIEKVALGNTVGSISEYLGLIKSYFPNEVLQQEYIIKAIPLALQLTLLGYLDSLLTALVIDRMTKEGTNQNKELIAQGLSNAASAIMQGIPGAQATIRSVLLIKEGAKTRLSGVLLGLFVLICIIFFQGWITLIPAAVFSGVLFKAGWDVCDREYTSMYFKKNWIKSFNRNFQMFIILLTTIITVIFDLNAAVIAGTVIFYLGKNILTKYNITDVEIEYEEEID